MIRVLIVEDDSTKLQRIAAVLRDAGVPVEFISDARSANQAKAWLRSQSCELMILDINLPRQLDEPPIKDGGLTLLNEISERDKFNKPTHVVGLTEFSDSFASAVPVFEQALISVIMYDRTNDSWAARLRQKVEYIIATRVETTENVAGFDYDVAVITALEKPELDAVLRLPWKWRPLTYPNDDTAYFQGSADTPRQMVRVVAAASPFVGMPSAVALSMKMISHFRPRFLIHCGITAAVRGRAEFGDVLVADPSWDWGSGKVSLAKGKATFFAAPYQIMLREDIRGRIRRLAANEIKLASIKTNWPGRTPASSLSVHLGPVASGASVLGDGKTAQEIMVQHRKLLGVEMESYGVMAAAEFCTRPRPLAVSLKSVCDFADAEKNDDMHPYAAYTSAGCVRALVEDYLF